MNLAKSLDDGKTADLPNLKYEHLDEFLERFNKSHNKAEWPVISSVFERTIKIS
jgi:hypothetical protein